MDRFPKFPTIVLFLAALLAVSLSCASRRAAEPRIDIARPVPEPGGVPPPLGSIKDHDISGSPCGAFSIDGIALGMTLDQVKALQPVAQAPAQESPLTGRMESIYYFRARRGSRRDYVQIGLDSDAGDAGVVSIRATIVAGEKDTWPTSIFKMIGSPRAGKLDEWGWWDSVCGAAMKVDRISALGPGASSGQPYSVEIRPFH